MIDSFGRRDRRRNADCALLPRGVKRRTRSAQPRPCAAALDFVVGCADHPFCSEATGRLQMKLYDHPVSTTSRPVVLFAHESGIELEYRIDDGDFRLTESSAILKYLADKTGSPAHPTDPRKRARVNERLDWFNTGFYRDFSYGFVYPQIFPFMRRPDDVVRRIGDGT